MATTTLPVEDGLHSETSPLLLPVNRGKNAAEVPTPKQERAARWHIVVLCWSLFLIGWSDASAGPLLPSIMETFNVGN